MSFTTAILLIAGSGERFQSALPKQFHPLGGKRVYLHTLDLFVRSQLFSQIILIVQAPWKSLVHQEIQGYPEGLIQVVIGGDSRQASSYQGLLHCDPQTDYVVIHDGVRPFVSEEILKENVVAASRYGAVDTCIASADTLVYAPGARNVESIPERSHYLRGQTPQSFHYPLILAAHQEAILKQEPPVSDDCSLVLRQGHLVHIVKGDESNLKITSELDLFLAEQLLRLKRTTLPSSAPTRSLSGKKIVVTGGHGGIGTKVCERLRAEGAVPLILSRSASPYGVDLTSFSQTQTLFNALYQEHGPLDGLVHSVGYLKKGVLHALSLEEIDQQIHSNLTSLIYSCRCAILHPQSHVIAIGSSSYTRGRPDYALYSSAKAALVNFMQAFAQEQPQLHINTIIPQRTHTLMRTENFPGEDPSSLLNPDSVAIEVISLLKQEGITGSLIDVKRSLPEHLSTGST